MKKLQLSNADAVALVSDEDYDWLSQWPWHRSNGGLPHLWYARRTAWIPELKKCKTLRMHREIYTRIDSTYTGPIDHKDRDGLNNCRSNLRPTTNGLNVANGRLRHNKTSKYRGVCWHKRSNKWRAQIKCNGAMRWLGDFDDEVEAAVAYDTVAKEVFGSFASLNFGD